MPLGLSMGLGLNIAAVGGGGGGGGFVFGSATNLLTKTQTFNDAVYSLGSGASISANATSAPDGTTTADGYATGIHLGDSQGYIQQGPVSISTSTVYTMSLYVKNNGWQWIAMSIYDSAHQRAWFDVQNGVVGTRSASLSNHTITSIGGGWYRITITRTSDATSGYFNLLLTDADNSTGQAGASPTPAVYLWGAQLETGASATAYNNASP